MCYRQSKKAVATGGCRNGCLLLVVAERIPLSSEPGGVGHFNGEL